MKKTILILISILFVCCSYSQGVKKIIKDVSAVTDTLSYIKTTAEELMKDILTWKSDSIVGDAKGHYIKLRGKVAGTLNSVAVYIRNPGNNSTKENFRITINKKLSELCKDLNAFVAFYVKSDFYIRKGAGFSNPIVQIVPVIIEIGKQVYNTIVAIIAAKREQLITQMKTDCNLLEWNELKD